MNKKDALLRLNELAYRRILNFIANLTAEEKAVVGKIDDWSIKDALVHCAIWNERMGHNLQAIARGEPTTAYPNYIELNDRDFNIHRDDSWEHVEEMQFEAYKVVKIGLERLSERQLEETELLPGDNSRRTWWRVCTTCVTHPMIHMSEFEVKRGTPERGLDLVLDFSELMLQLSDEEEWVAGVHYNKACYFALTGQNERAINILSDVLPTSSSLAEWAKEDSDLDSLRGEEQFEALLPVAVN